MSKRSDRKRVARKRAAERLERRATRRRTSRLKAGAWAAGSALAITGLVAGLRAVTSRPEPKRSPTPQATVASCTGPKPPAPNRDPGPFTAPPSSEINLDKIYVATISTYCGDLAFKIDPREAPEAARSFLFLARKKYYDSLAIDRVVAGKPAYIVADAEGNPGYMLPGAGPAASGKADLVMLAGQDTMVRGSFMIVIEPGRGLPAGPRIGTLLEGSDTAPEILDRFLAQQRSGERPAFPLYIVHVEIREFDRS